MNSLGCELTDWQFGATSRRAAVPGQKVAVLTQL